MPTYTILRSHNLLPPRLRAGGICLPGLLPGQALSPRFAEVSFLFSHRYYDSYLVREGYACALRHVILVSHVFFKIFRKRKRKANQIEAR